MIKRSFFFVLGFITGIAILYWPRKDVEVMEEEYDAIFFFSVNDTTDFIVEYLSRAGYSYVGLRPLPLNQTTQWEYRMQDAPDWAIREHCETLAKLGVNPSVQIIRKSDSKILPWV
ncbi:hypothetical protein LCGC14_1859230 [marine sediment metagenome]|uniref:Uncharacterized protein n=1 Tax=marine sediment metagenome TaxID=412755 RepID=A0A0F9G8A8_9ZZZZ